MTTLESEATNVHTSRSPQWRGRPSQFQAAALGLCDEFASPLGELERGLA